MKHSKHPLVQLALVGLYGLVLLSGSKVLGLDRDATAVVMGCGLMALAIAEIIRDAISSQAAKRHSAARGR
jgi:ABC-type amino acid transport system permease subunit